MKTLTATQARESLDNVLSRVLQGEDIGIVHPESGRIIALRPMKVYSEDYGLVEYGLTEEELKRAVGKITKQAKREKTQRWDGTVRSLRG